MPRWTPHRPMVFMASCHPQALVASRATQLSLFVPSLLPSLSSPTAAAGAAESSRRTHTRSKQLTHTWSSPPFMNPAGNRPLGTRPVLAYHLAPAAARVGSGSACKGVRSRYLVRGQAGRDATGVLGNGTREESLPGMSGERATEGEQQERVCGGRIVKEFPVKPRVPLPASGPLAAPDWVRKAVAEQPWKGGLEPCGEQSYGLAVESVEGTIPDELKGGTLYRCGPGRIRIGDTKYAHWFDGDGMVYALHIHDDATRQQTRNVAQFECRWVRTSAFEKREEGAASGIAVKGAWTAASGGPLLQNIGLPANPVNTSIIKFGGRVLALCEGGQPREVDPITLHTKGSVSFEGMPNCAFSAHPKLDPDTLELYNFGLSMLNNAMRQFYPMVLSPRDGGRSARAGPPVQLQSCDGPTLVHDCAMSANHLVFAVPPYNASTQAMLLTGVGLGTIGEELMWHDDKPTEFLFLSKTSLELVGRVGVFPPFSSYHFCNAWEEDGRLHVLLCVLDGPRDSLESTFKDMYGTSWQRHTQNSLWEFEFDMATWRVISQRPAMTPIASSSASPRPSAQLTQAARSVGKGASEVLGMEFPQVNPRYVGKKSRFVYVLASAEERLVPSGPSHAYTVKESASGTGVHNEVGAAAPADAPAAAGVAAGSTMLVNGSARFGYLNCMQKYDLETGQVQTHMFPPGWYLGDSNFVPKRPPRAPRQIEPGESTSFSEAGVLAAEDEGYVLTAVYDSFTHTSKVVALDAERFEGPPACIISLSTHVPYYFHGAWAGQE